MPKALNPQRLINPPQNGRKPGVVGGWCTRDLAPLLVSLSSTPPDLPSASEVHLFGSFGSHISPQLLSPSLSKDLVICCLDTAAVVSPPLIHFNWKVIVMQTLFGIICGSVLLELPQLSFPPN